MRKLILPLLLFSPLVAQAFETSPFLTCYDKAYRDLNNVDSVKLCVNVGKRFSSCYEKAYRELNNIDSVKLCANVGENFAECYDKANRDLNNIESIGVCSKR